MLFCIFYIAFLLLVVNAMHNVTVDDNNRDYPIIYRPFDSWNVSALDVLDAGGTLHLTIDPNANASLTFTGFAIYFYSPLWTFQVTTLVTLDSLSPVLLDLRDYTKPLVIDGPESVQSKVVWSHTGLANTRHTLLVSVGPGQSLAILDTLVYTVLDVNDPSPYPSAATVKRDLAISISVVGTSIAVLIFLLWWFCIRRKGGNGGNGGNMNQITPQCHTVPTIPENGKNVNDNLYEPPTTLSHNRGYSSYSGLPSALYTNDSASSIPRTPHHPQGRISTLPMMTDNSPNLDESIPVSSSSSIGNTNNEKSEKFRRIPANTAMAEPEVESTSTSIPGLGSRAQQQIHHDRIPANTATAMAEPEVESTSTLIPGLESRAQQQIHHDRIPANTAMAEQEVELTSTSIPGLGSREEIVSVYGSGYPQPVKFIPIA